MCSPLCGASGLPWWAQLGGIFVRPPVIAGLPAARFQQTPELWRLLWRRPRLFQAQKLQGLLIPAQAVKCQSPEEGLAWQIL